MYAVFLAALRYVLGFVFQQVAVKFVLFVALYLFVVEAIPWVVNKVPVLSKGFGTVSSDLANLPQLAIWLMSFCDFQDGLPIVISAVCARFFIRRLPLIG